MKNIALIRIPFVTFSSEEVPGQGIYRGCGVDAFTDQVSERLRSALSLSDMKCGAVGRIFKPYGSGFTARGARLHYLVTICAEPNGSAGANITISANPRRDPVASWSSFEPRFRFAVQAEFPDCDCHWMTADEFVRRT
jgi:hypothetical protein